MEWGSAVFAMCFQIRRGSRLFKVEAKDNLPLGGNFHRPREGNVFTRVCVPISQSLTGADMSCDLSHGTSPNTSLSPPPLKHGDLPGSAPRPFSKQAVGLRLKGLLVWYYLVSTHIVSVMQRHPESGKAKFLLKILRTPCSGNWFRTPPQPPPPRWSMWRLIAVSPKDTI